MSQAIFDALQTAMIEYTGFQNAQFALTHPGGAVCRPAAAISTNRHFSITPTAPK